ncbi:MAG: hypothetical protein JJT94_02095, partial [Bernardetiaceae bacterium]|nr:hypothetical protein [Bernardetiaceae bacterium]
VKTCSADGTALTSGRVGHRPPYYKKKCITSNPEGDALFFSMVFFGGAIKLVNHIKHLLY